MGRPEDERRVLPEKRHVGRERRDGAGVAWSTGLARCEAETDRKNRCARQRAEDRHGYSDDTSPEHRSGAVAAHARRPGRPSFAAEGGTWCMGIVERFQVMGWGAVEPAPGALTSILPEGRGRRAQGNLRGGIPRMQFSRASLAHDHSSCGETSMELTKPPIPIRRRSCSRRTQNADQAHDAKPQADLDGWAGLDDVVK